VLEHLKASFLLCVALGCCLGVLALILFPFLLDSWFDLLLFCLCLPAAFGLVAGLFCCALDRWVPFVRRRLEGFTLPFAYAVSLLFLIVAGVLSELIFLLTSAPLGVHVVLLAVYVAMWPVVLSVTKRVKVRPSNRHLALMVLVLFIGVLLLYAGRTSFRNFTVPARVCIFGIDAATWTFMDPLIEKGQLPNVASLKREGSYGVLKSMDPMVSPIIWTSIATGKVPEKHGIQDFYSPQSSLRAKRLWDLFEERGMRIGVYKWLVTWPPREVNGFVIPGALARDDRTFPPEYRALNTLRISEKLGYRRDARAYAKLTWSLLGMGLRMSTLREVGCCFLWDELRGAGPLARYPLKRRAELLLNKDVFIFLLKKYQSEFVVFYDNAVDTISHRYWKYYEPQYFPDVTPEEAEQYGEVIADFYRLLDRTLGELLQYLNEDTLVVLASDHGQEAAVRDEDRKTLYFPKLSDLLRRLELDEVVYATALGARSYVRAKDPTQADPLGKAREKMERVKVVETGQALFEITPDPLGWIVEVRKGAADFSHHVRVEDQDLPMEDVIYRIPPMSGAHHIDGVLLMKGPEVRAGIEIPEAGVLDVAPTVLYLERLPISQEIDGKILFPAIKEEFRLAYAPEVVPEVTAEQVPLSPSTEFDPVLEERLKALGYVQ